MKTNELFDQEKLEEYIPKHEDHFQTRYNPDKRTKEFISNKRKLFASVYPKQRDSTVNNLVGTLSDQIGPGKFCG